MTVNVLEYVEDMCLLSKPDDQYKTLGRELTSESAYKCRIRLRIRDLRTCRRRLAAQWH